MTQDNFFQEAWFLDDGFRPALDGELKGGEEFQAANDIPTSCQKKSLFAAFSLTDVIMRVKELRPEVFFGKHGPPMMQNNLLGKIGFSMIDLVQLLMVS